jgi:hypothetical protein
MRNALDHKEKRMEMEEMREKRKAEVEKIFKQMNKVRLFVNFVRAADNPLEKDNSESADIVAMIQKIYEMSSNMTDWYAMHDFFIMVVIGPDMLSRIMCFVISSHPST